MVDWNDPRQTALCEEVLSQVACRKLKTGWPHLFRSAILKLMPAQKLAEPFHPEIGLPTRELYSMAGLLFVMKLCNWTHEEAANAICLTSSFFSKSVRRVTARLRT